MPDTCATCAYAVGWKRVALAPFYSVSELVIADCPMLTRKGVVGSETLACDEYRAVPGPPCGGLLNEKGKPE